MLHFCNDGGGGENKYQCPFNLCEQQNRKVSSERSKTTGYKATLRWRESSAGSGNSLRKTLLAAEILYFNFLK